MRIPLIVGNWKMFKSIEEAKAYGEEFKELYRGTDVKVAICAPFTCLKVLKDIFIGTSIGVGAQNVHFEDEGAFTGEISVPMLEELDVDYCIVGHSERRQYFAETDETVNRKVIRLLKSKISPILCVGESLADREAGREESVVRAQLKRGLESVHRKDMERVIVAYEPIWAIGTGKTATPEDADRMCGYVRDVIEDLYDEDVALSVVIQYGGSMKAENATELMNMISVDGGLVGGASLSPRGFMDIVNF